MLPNRSLASSLSVIAVSLLLVSCAGSPVLAPEGEQTESVFGVQATEIESLLQLARRSPSPEAEGYQLDAVALLLEAGSINEAQTLLTEIRTPGILPEELQVRYRLAQISVALAQEQPALALQGLDNPLFESVETLTPDLQIEVRQLRADTMFQSQQYLAAVRERIQLAPLLAQDARIANNNAIWEILSSASGSALTNAGNNVDSYELRGWLELLRLVSSNQYNIQTQMSAMDQWLNTWTQHSASTRLPDALNIIYEIWQNRPRDIALVLPIQEPLGKAISEGLLSAYYDALAKGQDVPRIHIYDTSFRTDVLVLYDQAVDDGADLIIGPLLKDAVRRMQRSSRPMPVPTLALNYGDPGGGTPGGLYQFGLAPEDEIMQAADTAWAAGHRNAAVLTPTGGDYQRIQDTFVNYWEGLGGHIISVNTFAGANDYSAVIKRIFSIEASEARAARIRSLLPRNSIEFVPRRRQDVDFIFLLANPGEGRQIKPTLSFYFAGDVPVYAMPAIYDGGSNPIANRDLNGIVFNDAPWVLSSQDPLKTIVNDTWSAAFGPVQRLRAMGADSYRLYLRLEQMHLFPYTHLDGATGRLHMKADGGIKRELNNAVIVDGVANALPR